MYRGRWGKPLEISTGHLKLQAIMECENEKQIEEHTN